MAFYDKYKAFNDTIMRGLNSLSDRANPFDRDFQNRYAPVVRQAVNRYAPQAQQIVRQAPQLVRQAWEQQAPVVRQAANVANFVVNPVPKIRIATQATNDFFTKPVGPSAPIKPLTPTNFELPSLKPVIKNQKIDTMAQFMSPAYGLLRQGKNIGNILLGSPQERQRQRDLENQAYEIGKKYNLPVSMHGAGGTVITKEMLSGKNLSQEEKNILAEANKETLQRTINFVGDQDFGATKNISKLTKPVLEALAKETTERGVKKILGKITNDADVIKKLVKETDPKKVINILDSAKSKKLVDTTLQAEKQVSKNTPKVPEEMTPNVRLGQDGLPETPQPQGKLLGQSETPEVATNLNKKIESSKDIISQSNYKTRRFVQRVFNDPNVPAKNKADLDGLYSVRDTKELAIKAKNLVNNDPDFALNIARNANDDKGIAVGMELVGKLQREGNYELAIDLSNELAEKLTKSGQMSQAASIYGKLTPEGVLRFTQREISKYNNLTGKNLTLDKAKAEQLTKMAQKIQDMAEGEAKTTEIARLMKEIHSTFPSTWVKKAVTLQTIGQLLNPKTWARNILGNTGFMVVENASQTVATPIDMAVSLITGKRTVSLPGLKTQIKSYGDNLAKGAKESFEGINTGPKTQFELSDVPVFKNKILSSLEKTMNFELRAFDRASFGAAFDDTIRSLQKINKTDKVTPEMLDEATFTGLYRTFQDENNTTKLFQGLKKAFNYIGIKRGNDTIGLGEFILKYPKTPANLINRAFAYSPAGFVKSIFEIARPVFTKQPFRQSQFSMGLARAGVGTTTLFGAGMLLGELGILTNTPSTDKDVRAAQSQTGEGAYKINASALRRFIFSGFNPEEAKKQENDLLISYDWFQPFAPTISFGAATAQGESGTKGAMSSIEAGVNTLAEQGLVKGISGLIKGSSLVEAGKDTLQSIPTSFIPTISSQVRQWTDNTRRQVYDPNWFKETLNMVKNKLPGFSNQLPSQQSSLGEGQEIYQNGSNNFFNVFLNPAFVSRVKTNPELKEVMDLMDSTGESTQLPRVVDKKVTINGQTKILSAEEYYRYQKYVGQRTQQVIKALMKDPNYNQLSDEQKVNSISSALQKINSAAKIELFGSNTKPDAGTRAIMEMGAVIGSTELPMPGEGNFEKSADNQGAMAYINGLITDPRNTIDALFTGVPLRKNVAGESIYERGQLSGLDAGQQETVVDHKIPLSLGGTNSPDNLQILPEAENQAKAKYEVELLNKVKSGQMSMKQAQQAMANWKPTTTPTLTTNTTKAGNVSITNKSSKSSAVDYQQYRLDLSRARRAGDTKVYINIQEGRVKYLKDRIASSKDEAEKLKLINQLEAIQEDIAKKRVKGLSSSGKSSKKRRSVKLKTKSRRTGKTITVNVTPGKMTTRNTHSAIKISKAAPKSPLSVALKGGKSGRRTKIKLRSRRA